MRTSLLRFLALVVALCAATACGGYQSELKVSLATVDGAAAAFEKFDKPHQEQILAKATSADELKTNLDAYRKKQQAVLDGLILAYRAIATAETSPSDITVSTASADVAALLALLKDLGVTIPGSAPTPTPTASTGGK